MTRSEYLANSRFPELAAAVLDQFGDSEEFIDSYAKDISEHGADGGFNGFTYYTETTDFARKNLKAIRAALSSLSDDLGEPIIKIVSGFKYLSDYSQDEIGEVLYTGACEADPDAADSILNNLAWFALEEVAREVEDAKGWTATTIR